MSHEIAVRLSFLALPVLVVGCGGGAENTPPPAAPVAQAPPPAAPIVAGDPAAAAAANPVVQPRVVPPGATTTPLPAGVDPDDVFEVVEDGNLFEVVPATASEDDTFTITPLDDGASGSTFFTSGSPSSARGTQRPGLTLPPNFEAMPEYGFTDQGYPKRIKCLVDRSQMVLVPAGHFRLGTDDGPENAGPAVSAFLDDYYIDVAEVTFAQYAAFRDTLADTEKRRARLPLNADGEKYEPVHGVRFTDAAAYARWCGKDLPTEAEWEKAARGTAGRFPWGNGRALFSRHREQTDIDRIMSFPQDVSPYGVWDMAGNAREWCADWYAPDAYQKAFDSGETFSNWTGPRNPGPDYLRVVKGNGPTWAAWHREGLDGAQQIPGVGFRCVLRKPPAARTGNR